MMVMMTDDYIDDDIDDKEVLKILYEHYER